MIPTFFDVRNDPVIFLNVRNSIQGICGMVVELTIFNNVMVYIMQNRGNIY